MTARILSYLIIAMLCFTQLSACSDGGLNDASTVVLAGIDYSGSVTAERREYIRRTLDGMVTRLQAGQRLLVLPIHRNTATAGYLVDARLQSNEHGRRADLAIDRQRSQLRHQLDSLLTLHFGSTGNGTDVLGFIRRAVQLTDELHHPVRLVIFSDMWQEGQTVNFQRCYRVVSPDTLANRIAMNSTGLHEMMRSGCKRWSICHPVVRDMEMRRRPTGRIGFG